MIENGHLADWSQVLLWRRLLYRFSKRLSPTTVLLRTPIIQMIIFNQGENTFDWLLLVEGFWGPISYNWYKSTALQQGRLFRIFENYNVEDIWQYLYHTYLLQKPQPFTTNVYICLAIYSDFALSRSSSVMTPHFSQLGVVLCFLTQRKFR